jgi:Na+/proline symporter
LLTSLALVIPLFIYTTVQFIALADIIEGLSLGRIQRQTAASMLCGVIIVCEVMGGQRSVTISDTVQASIMMAAFLVMPFVLVYFYGGLPDIVEPNCPRSHRLADGTFAGCVAYNRPWIIQTPTVTSSCDVQNNLTDTSCYAGFNESAYQPPINPNTDPDFQHVALSMLMFNLNGMAFGLNPHFLQKVFAAKSDLVLKRSLMLLTVAALVTNLPSLYYGFVRVAAMPDAEGSAFSVVTGKMIDRGGFSEIVAVIASCSALAAIMSTADSAIIGANNLLTVEWVKNFLWRGASPQQIEYVSKGFTVGFAICALIFSFNVDKIPFAALFNLQVSQNFQAPRVV